MKPQPFTCPACGREQTVEPRDLRRHPRYPNDCFEVRCRFRDCTTPSAVAVDARGTLSQWAARTDRRRPGQLEVAPRSEADHWGPKPTHTPMDLAEYSATRSGRPGRLKAVP